MRRWCASVALLLGGVLGLAPVLVAAPPDWLLETAKTPVPSFPAEVPAVVLRNEMYVEVQPDGREVTVRRFAVRIRNAAGRDRAVGLVTYTEKQSKVERAEAWLIRAGKEVRPRETRAWDDRSAVDGQVLYTEARTKTVGYSDLALAGDVFGYETRVADRLQFADDIWSWASELPVLECRYSLKLPAGWGLESSLVGPKADAIDCRERDNLRTWTLVDEPYRPDEPMMAAAGRCDADLFLRIVPPSGAVAGLLSFGSWSSLREWASQVQDAQCDSSPALAADVAAQTSGCPDPLVKMRALSRYVQGLRYVAIDKDLAKQGGYRPRKASEVHRRGWGDCKDKANLLRAMLREAGIESFMVVARGSEGWRVNSDWPSVSQFNHAILAIRVDGTVDLPAVVETAQWGRLLFFDATVNDVLLGDLPEPLQGSKVLLLAPGCDGLLTLPVLPLETSHVLERRLHLVLDSSGGLAGECDSGGPAEAGADYRRYVRTITPKDLLARITDHLCATVRGAVISDFEPVDDLGSGICRFRYRFAAPRYAQLMPGGLMVVNLDVLGRDDAPAFPALERRLPVLLPPRLYRDEITLELPAGVAPDELPEDCSLSSDFGSYESRYEVKDGAILVHRTLRTEDRVVPVAEYAALRKFFLEVAKADHAAVVLQRE